jgi:hypothetical protein
VSLLTDLEEVFVQSPMLYLSCLPSHLRDLTPYLSSLGLSFSGFCLLLLFCFLKVAHAPGEWEALAVVVPVPPFTCLLRNLAPATNYSLRVRCANALGPSPYGDWVPFQTKGLGKKLSRRGRAGEGRHHSFSERLLSTYYMLLHTMLYLVLIEGPDR